MNPGRPDDIPMQQLILRPRPVAAALLAALLAAGPLAGTPSAAPSGSRWAELDLKDGPDVDLRFVIESDEVRLRIITNLAFIDRTTESFREDPGTLDPAEAEEAMEGLVELFEANNRVIIDGVEATPVEPTVRDAFEFDPGDPTLYSHFRQFGARAVCRTRLTLRYPCKTPPSSVKLTWGVYPINEAQPPEPDGYRPPLEPIARLVADGREQIVRFNVDEPTFTWVKAPDGEETFLEAVPDIERTGGGEVPAPVIVFALGAAAGLAFGPRRLRRPLFGPALAVAGILGAYMYATETVERPEGPAARSVFEPLLTNIYRAFDYTEESRIYDVLERSASGPVLRDLYDDIYKGLVLQEEEGSLCRAERVTFVEVADAEPTTDERFAVEALWIVDGVVYHSDHGHTQKNEHRARFEVEATEGGWRIADYVVLGQRRLDAEPIAPPEPRTGPKWRSADGGLGPDESQGEF